MEKFQRIRGERGQFDLLPPNSASIHRLITEPARLAGLHFERNEQSGRSLDELILADASKSPDALPLLEYSLSELYRQRDEDRYLLTYAAYIELGGVEGAIGKCAEETFSNLPADAQAALDGVLPLLISVDVAGEQSAVRRRATIADLTSTPARKTLTDSLTESRFLTTDREGDSPITSLAHEALLRRWDRIVIWITTNREHLQLRTRIEQSQKRYEQQDSEKSLLLPEGLPLDEGRKLLTEAPHLLTESTRQYIDTSINRHDRQAKRRRRDRVIVRSTLAALLAVVAFYLRGVYLRRSTTVETLMWELSQARTTDVPQIIEELSDYPNLARPALNVALDASEEGSDARLYAMLALDAHDGSMESDLVERLFTAKPEHVPMIASILKKQGAYPSGRLWCFLLDRQDAPLLNIAGALAIFDAERAEVDRDSATNC